MAESIKFREGLNQLEDASMNSPYDLRNAYIEPSHIVKALNGPSSDTTVTQPDYSADIVKHAGTWLRVRSSLKYRSILYTSDPADYRIDIYPRGKKTEESDFPKILEVTLNEGPEQSYTALNPSGFDSSEPRIIMYAFIPVNKRGEAGIWKYRAWKVDNGKLPQIQITGTPQTEYVEIYRTAEMKPDISGSVGPVQSLHYLGRYSSAAISGSSGGGKGYWTSVPGRDAAENQDAYHTQSSVDYFYLSETNFEELVSNTSTYVFGQRFLRSLDFSNTNIKDWRVVFDDVFSVSSNTLSAGTEYFVRKTDGHKIYLEDSGGSNLTFSPNELVKADFEDGIGEYNRVVQNLETVGSTLKPPTGLEQPGSDIFVIDGKKWSWDQGKKKGNQDYKPETRILERDRTLHGRTLLRKSATGEDLSSGDRFKISGEDASDLYEAGDVITFVPDVSNILTATATGEVVMSGSATLDIDAGGNVIVVLDRFKEKANGDVTFTYRIEAGSADFTVELQRKSNFSDTSVSFGTTVSNTETSTGEYTIVDTDPQSALYRIKVTDTNTDTDISRQVIYIQEGDIDIQPAQYRVGPSDEDTQTIGRQI